MKVIDVFNAVNNICDFKSAYPWDNCGLLCGDKDAKVTKILVTLDADIAALNKAIEIGANTVVSHHPMIYDALKQITPDVCVYHYIKNNINVIAAHTCLDAANGGVSDTLASLCALENVSAVYDGDVPIYRVGDSKISNADEFIKSVCDALPSNRCDAVICGDVKRVIVAGGSGGAVPQLAKQMGIDTCVTGECKHSVFIAARNLGINLFSFGHFETENPIVKVLAKKLGELLPTAEIFEFINNNPVSRR